jgi:hypothetical protein
MQAPPFGPHCDVLWLVTQVVPLQHPDGQLVASQTQAPAEQRCPAPHCAPPPQRHTPVGEQLSATVELHALHAAPL